MTKNKWNGPPKEAGCLLSEGLHSEPQVIITLNTGEAVKLEDWWYACSVLFLAQYSVFFGVCFWFWVFFINIFTNTQIMAELLQSNKKKVLPVNMTLVI